MENIFNPVYRKDYLSGYSSGLNPLIKDNFYQNNQAFHSGFASGRADYERMNGSLIYGIPEKIITNAVLEDFLLAGLLGMSINAEGYTPYQMLVIEKWYQSGIEQYDPNESIYLLALLEKNGISTY